jgi:hypothetical protein
MRVEAFAVASETEEGPMIRFKACRRCKGDIVLVEDRYSSYPHCLQCGWALDELPAKAPVPLGQEVRKAA